MNILYIKDQTHLKDILQAIAACSDRTLVICADRAIEQIRIHAPKVEELTKAVYIKKELNRKPWKERPKF
jgi:hypothetical protein